MSDRHTILAWFERGAIASFHLEKSLPVAELNGGADAREKNLSPPLTAKWVKRDDNRLKSP